MYINANTPLNAGYPTQQISGFASQNRENESLWNGKKMTAVTGEKLVAEGKRFYEEYLDQDTLWEKIRNGSSDSMGFGMNLGGIAVLALAKVGYWPVYEETLNLGFTTVSTMVMGYDTSMPISFALGMSAVIGCLVGAGVAHIAVKGLHTYLFGRKNECIKRLLEAQNSLINWQRISQEGNNIKENAIKIIRKRISWFSGCQSREDFVEKLKEKHQEHLESVEENNRNWRDRDRGAKRKNNYKCASYEEEWRTNNQYTSFSPSPESTGYRLMLLEDQGVTDTVSSRLLRRKERDGIRTLAEAESETQKTVTRSKSIQHRVWEGIVSCGNNLRRVYEERFSLQSLRKKEDTFEFDIKVKRADEYFVIDKKSKKAERERAYYENRTARIMGDYNRLR